LTQSEFESRLRAQVAAVEERIAAACRRSGRPRADVTLVAVTKTVSADVAALLPKMGVYNLGENRPQELWRKVKAFTSFSDEHRERVHWHMIGHLQRNKIERTVPLVTLIHSVDSVRLLQALEAEAQKGPAPLPVLLEVNMSREPNKHGFAPEDLPELVSGLSAFRHVHVQGLMTMAALDDEPERCRPTFHSLRELRDGLRGLAPTPHTFSALSMGMSNDFEVAIEEGATLVRIGTALVGGLTEETP
jgi:PLP dependent protein